MYCIKKMGLTFTLLTPSVPLGFRTIVINELSKLKFGLRVLHFITIFGIKGISLGINVTMRYCFCFREEKHSHS